MKIEIDTVKGFQDFLPPESLKREAIVETIKRIYRLYGFVPIETPLIEFDELMKPESLPNEQEDEAVSDRFRLKDKGGRNLGIRYEFTFQLSRILKQNPNMKLPLKRYQIGPILRDEPTSSNRFRQFTQCDADIVGDPSINADAECLSLVSDILKALNIDAEIQINNRKLLSSIIESVEIKSTKQVMRELDKLEKVGEDEVKANLKKYADSNQIITLFKLLEKSLEFFTENAFEGAKEIQELMDKCRAYNVSIRFNPFMIRGLDYYTGNVFEVISANKENGGTIAAGGRYDKTVGKFLNKEIPAVGISFGLERIAGLAKIIPETVPKIALISISQDKETIKLAKKLRKSDISCITLFEKTGKALEYTNSLEIPYAVFIGEQEIEQEKFKLRDMKSGEEKLLTEKQLIKLFSK